MGSCLDATLERAPPHEGRSALNPIELAQPGISVTDSWQEAGGVAVARTLPKHDIRSEKDRAWRRHAREQARRSGRVAGLLGVDATAVVAGLLAAVLFAPALFSARVLVSQEYYLLPQDTFPAFLTLQILLLAATAAYAGKATSAYGRIAAASILASILFYAGLTLYTDLGITRPAMLLVGGSVLSMLTMGRWLDDPRWRDERQRTHGAAEREPCSRLRDRRG